MQVLNFHKGNAHIYWLYYCRTVRITRKGKAVIEILEYIPTTRKSIVIRYISDGKFQSIEQIDRIMSDEYNRQWFGQDDQE